MQANLKLLLISLLRKYPSHYKNNQHKKKGKTKQFKKPTETIGNKNRPKVVMLELSERDFKTMTSRGA